MVFVELLSLSNLCAAFHLFLKVCVNMLYTDYPVGCCYMTEA